MDIKTPRGREEGSNSKYGKARVQKLWIILFTLFAFLASIFGTLADGKEVFGCNQKGDVSRNKVDHRKIKFKKFNGRWGCKFSYPEDWEIQKTGDFASMEKEVLHPIDHEIGLSYIDIYNPTNLNNVENLIAEEKKLLKKQGFEILSETTIEKEYEKRERKIYLGKLTYLHRSNYDKKVKKIGIKVFTELENEVFYGLEVFCPNENYGEYQDVLQSIIASLEFDCSKISNEN